MTIAVTAASGQLGAAIVRAVQALDDDREVIGLARTPANAADLGVEVRPGDYSDVAPLTESLAGVDAIIHAGDMGPYRLVLDMESIAPTTAVLGNTDGDMPINPSGGVLSTNPIGASGMLRFAEAAMQVRGQAGEHQVEGARRALGHAYGGGSQFFAMWIVGSQKP